MKTSALLLTFLFAAVTVAPAQSGSPAPNYFGTTNPHGAGTPDTADAPETSAPMHSDAKFDDNDVQFRATVRLLKTATDKLGSKTATAKTDALAAAESASAVLQKTTASTRYHGHRAKALKQLADVVALLRNGDKENKVAAGLAEVSAHIDACITADK